MSEPVETISPDPAGFRCRPGPGAAADRGFVNRYVARYGRTTLLLLAVIVAVGFLARAWFVVNPHADPGDDALAYRALAESLYEEGTYGGSGFKSASDWSPGAPLLYAGSYYLTGGVRDGVARGVEALAGTAAIVIVFLLTARLIQASGWPSAPPSPTRDGPGDASDRFASAATPVSGVSPGPSPTTSTRTVAIAPLLAAALVAFYPPFIDSAGSLMSEPPAYFLLPAGLLAFFWAESRRGLWPWLLPGFLFGLTTLVRPEYMAVTAALGLLVLVRVGAHRRTGSGRCRRPSSSAWRRCCRSSRGRSTTTSPSTGSCRSRPAAARRSSPAPTCPATASTSGSRRRCSSIRPGNAWPPVRPPWKRSTRCRSSTGSPRRTTRSSTGTPPSAGSAARTSTTTCPTDPLGYLGMTVRKVGRMWGTSSGGVMSSGIGALVQKLLVLAGAAGLALLAWRRRWEAVALAIPILGITAIGALTLAPPRRNEILMTLVLPLAAVAFTAVLDRFQSAESNS